MACISEYKLFFPLYISIFLSFQFLYFYFLMGKENDALEIKENNNNKNTLITWIFFLILFFFTGLEYMHF